MNLFCIFLIAITIFVKMYTVGASSCVTTTTSATTNINTFPLTDNKLKNKHVTSGTTSDDGDDGTHNKTFKICSCVDNGICNYNPSFLKTKTLTILINNVASDNNYVNASYVLIANVNRRFRCIVHLSFSVDYYSLMFNQGSIRSQLIRDGDNRTFFYESTTLKRPLSKVNAPLFSTCISLSNNESLILLTSLYNNPIIYTAPIQVDVLIKYY